MGNQRDFFREARDLFAQAQAPASRHKTADQDAPLYHFAHPYPRFGLAYTLFYHDISDNLETVVGDDEKLASLAADVIDDSLNYVRLHTEDRPNDDGKTELRFRYLSRSELKGERGNDQNSDHFYYMAPHVATGDTGTNRLIRKARDFRGKLRNGDKFYAKDREFKRSFSPFTTKINAGSPNLSDPKGSRLQVVFTLIATLARYKPAKQIDFENQVIIPDLDLKNLIRFIALFRRLHDSETGDVLTRTYEGDSKYHRPPIFRGNYPDAPPTQAFGPVGLMGAMGRWIQRAEHIEWAEDVVKKLPERALYLVSYEQNPIKQEHVGHHVADLALQHDLPKALRGLYRVRRYRIESDDSKTEQKQKRNQRKLFSKMTSRFLQFYTRSAFRDFLAFRVQYDASFSPILKNYFMSKERAIPKDIVQSARAYGAHLNEVAYFKGLEEEKENEKKEGGGTKRDRYEAKTRVLAQMESTAMSAKRPSALFARLNVDAGRMSDRDVPAAAGRFIEAATAEEINLDTTQELVLAFMRLRSDEDNTDDASDTGPPKPADKMAGVE